MEWNTLAHRFLISIITLTGVILLPFLSLQAENMAGESRLEAKLSQTANSPSYHVIYTIPPASDAQFVLLKTEAMPRTATLLCGTNPTQRLYPEHSARPAFRLPARATPCVLNVYPVSRAMKPDVVIMEEEAYHSSSLQRTQILSGALVSLTMLTLYLLSVSLALRTRMNVSFLVFSICFLGYQILRSGFYREWGWFFPDTAAHLKQTLQMIYPVSLLMFVLEFRPGHLRLPRIYLTMAAAGLLAGLVASFWLWPVWLAQSMELMLLTGAFVSSFHAWRRAEGPGLIVSNVLLYATILVPLLLPLATTRHPLLGNLSMLGGILHIVGISSVIGFRIHQLRKGEIRARERAARIWDSALEALDSARKSRVDFLSTTGSRLLQPLREMQEKATKLLKLGSRESERAAHQILEDCGRLIHLFSHSLEAQQSEEAARTSLASAVEDALTMVRLFPGPGVPRMLNDVNRSVTVEIRPNQFVHSINAFIETMSMLYPPASLSFTSDEEEEFVTLIILVRDHIPAESVKARAVQHRLAEDYLIRLLQELDPSPQVRGTINGQEYSVRLQKARPLESPAPTILALQPPQADFVLLYSEDILYRNRLHARVSESYPCYHASAEQPIPENCSHRPVAIVMDLLERDTPEAMSFVHKVRQGYQDFPPTLLLIRSEKTSLEHHLGPAMTDWIVKPASVELVFNRLQSLIALESKLQEQRGEFYSLAKRNQNQIRRSLHDSLGAQLTDLKFLADQLSRGKGSHRLTEEIEKTIRMLQRSLQDLEDSQAFAVDVIQGLEENLVRRYTQAGRKIRRSFPDVELQLQPETADELFRLIQELITNDLKYGRGPSHWSMTLGDEIQILMESGTEYDPARQSNGMGTGNVQERARELGGHVECSTKHGIFRANITLPVTLLQNTGTNREPEFSVNAPQG